MRNGEQGRGEEKERGRGERVEGMRLMGLWATKRPRSRVTLTTTQCNVEHQVFHSMYFAWSLARHISSSKHCGRCHLAARTVSTVSIVGINGAPGTGGAAASARKVGDRSGESFKGEARVKENS